HHKAKYSIPSLLYTILERNVSFCHTLNKRKGEIEMTNNRQFFNPFNPWGPSQGPGGGTFFPGEQSPSPFFPGGPIGPGTYPNQVGQGGNKAATSPTSPPPNFVPEQQVQTFAIDAGAIRRCLFRFTYIWLNRDGFWFYPVFVGRRSVSGYRWHRFRWVYVGISLNHIQSFQCY